MNNRCFRLIFSKPLGFLIPVAEIATAKRKPGQQKARSAVARSLIPGAFSLKRLPVYNSGIGRNGYFRGTKVHVFNGTNNSIIETPRIIKVVEDMFGDFGQVTKVKEFHQSGADFKKGAQAKFEQYILINAENGNAVADRAVQRLTAKHPEKTTVFVPDADGSMKLVTGVPKQGGGRTKFEVIGHGQNGKIGDLSALQIAAAVGKISSANNAMVEKLTLVGCESECEYNGIAEEVRYLLEKNEGLNVKVKGYPTPIIINEVARKQPVSPGTPGALGKDDPQASGGSDTSQERLDAIWDAQRNGIIGHDAAEYLQHVKNKTIEQLLEGPVLFGEAHNSPFASLLVRELVSENKLKRIVLEEVPLNDLYDFPKLTTTERMMEREGFASLDDYFSNLQVTEQMTPFYGLARNVLMNETRDMYRGYTGTLRSSIINSGVPFDFIDSGRLYDDETSDNKQEFSVRNSAMADKINSDAKYKQPGVLGIFGAEHLKTYPTHENLKGAALQQMVGVPEQRTHDLTSLFDDFDTNEEFYRWTSLGDNHALEPSMSEMWPYKPAVAGAAQQVLPRKVANHLVLNTAGETAEIAINQIRQTHPSTTIVFEALKGGGLNYIDGPSASYSWERPTKVFLFADDQTRLTDTPRWLKLAGVKLDRDPDAFMLKTLKLTPGGEFTLQPPVQSLMRGAAVSGKPDDAL